MRQAIDTAAKNSPVIAASFHSALLSSFFFTIRKYSHLSGKNAIFPDGDAKNGSPSGKNAIFPDGGGQGGARLGETLIYHSD
jgi:hypothetical protein